MLNSLPIELLYEIFYYVDYKDRARLFCTCIWIAKMEISKAQEIKIFIGKFCSRKDFILFAQFYNFCWWKNLHDVMDIILVELARKYWPENLLYSNFILIYYPAFFYMKLPLTINYLTHEFDPSKQICPLDKKNLTICDCSDFYLEIVSMVKCIGLKDTNYTLEKLRLRNRKFEKSLKKYELKFALNYAIWIRYENADNCRFRHKIINNIIRRKNFGPNDDLSWFTQMTYNKLAIDGNGKKIVEILDKKNFHKNIRMFGYRKILHNRNFIVNPNY